MILLQNIWVSEVDMPSWKALKYEEYVLVNGTYWYIGRRHILVLSSFMMGTTNGAGTAYPSGAPEFIAGF
jgi:hypothetical protein